MGVPMPDLPSDRSIKVLDWVYDFLFNQKQKSYYDYPEGEACFQKIGILCKTSLKYALIVGLVDAALISNYYTPYPYLMRVAVVATPIVLSAGTYGVAVCLSNNLRQTDDPFNHWCGGIAAGAVLGHALKSIKHGLLFSFILSSMAYQYKANYLQGYDTLSSHNPRRIPLGQYDYGDQYRKQGDIVLDREMGWPMDNKYYK